MSDALLVCKPEQDRMLGCKSVPTCLTDLAGDEECASIWHALC